MQATSSGAASEAQASTPGGELEEAPSVDELVMYESENLDKYKRNYLRQAVCELRFPTILELAVSKPPVAFAAALRKDYPILEQSNEVTVNLGARSGADLVHIFRATKGGWSVTLRQNALVVETTRYTTYAEMRERVIKVIAAATPVIDSDFFTRMGLRYVNVVMTAGEDLIENWINAELVGPLVAQKYFAGVHEFSGRLNLSVEEGGCLLQHGLKHKDAPDGSTLLPDYVLDIDTFRNDVELKDAVATLDKMHTQGFALFDWSLGDKARQYLGSTK